MSKESSISRYVLYATGEILLVMIGILLALQVNNWNQKNKDQQTSVEYHDRMIADTDLLINRLEAEIERADKLSKALKQSVGILESKVFSDSSMVVLDFALSRYFQISPFSLQLGSYEEMKSSGRLSLIYDLDLRQRLSSYSIYASIITNIVDQTTQNVNGNRDLFNKYIRVRVGRGSDHSIEYNADTVANDPLLINTLSRYSYDWDTYTYFLNVIVEQLSDLQNAILESKNKIQG